VELTAALKQVNALVTDRRGAGLREPEIIILKGTWQGFTYEQMAEGSEYSVNYLMRDIAPKLWRHLSSIFDRSVGKTNFRVALETFAAGSTTGELPAVSQRIDSKSDSSLINGVAPLKSTAQTPLSPQHLEDEIATRSITDNQHRLGSIAGATSVPGMSPISASSILYGYEGELALIKQWLAQGRVSTSTPAQGSLDGQVRLIGLWGLKGTGKSLLCETAIAQMEVPFEFVIRRSFKADCSLSDFCASILAEIGVAFRLEQAAEQLLTVLSQRQILLVFEGIEAILESRTLAGEYQRSHQNYRDFFQSALAASRSCILITGTESPVNWVSQDGHNSALRSCLLTGLSESAAIVLLAGEALSPSAYWPELIARYQGHPLALKSAARVIREMFNGRVDSFLTQISAPLHDTVHLLSVSFERLSEAENNVLYWLASQEGPLSLSELQQTVPLSQDGTALISVLDSLKQRSLLTIQTDLDYPVFNLPPLVKSYVIQQLIAKFTPSEPATSSLRIPPPFPASNIRNKHLLTLSSPIDQPTHLSQWVDGSFGAEWQPLSQLFEGSTGSTVRLRNTYHLRNETFIKRCKSIPLQEPTDGSKKVSVENSIDIGQSVPAGQAIAEVMMVVAIYEEAENRYEICVQVQPAKGEKRLPDAMTLKLLDNQQSVLAEVNASQGDTFLQLPYFLGKTAESFVVELQLNNIHHSEMFLV